MFPVEIGYHAMSLAAAKAGYGVEDKATGLVEAGKVVEADLLQELRKRKESPGVEPF